MDDDPIEENSARQLLEKKILRLKKTRTNLIGTKTYNERDSIIADMDKHIRICQQELDGLRRRKEK